MGRAEVLVEEFGDGWVADRERVEFGAEGAQAPEGGSGAFHGVAATPDRSQDLPESAAALGVPFRARVSPALNRGFRSPGDQARAAGRGEGDALSDAHGVVVPAGGDAATDDDVAAAGVADGGGHSEIPYERRELPFGGGSGGNAEPGCAAECDQAGPAAKVVLAGSRTIHRSRTVRGTGPMPVDPGTPWPPLLSGMPPGAVHAGTE
ncbi:hypothetical protein GCM10023205_73700 [Yinghuangia aomiensis]|uniref:Uncharacterized protein n=1 Tax=Yinghuangia aomiensis TaxID=676205 RepID=A0ABP9I9E1_9ACTN